MDLWNDDATQPLSTREALWLEDAHAFAQGCMSSFESHYDQFCTSGTYEPAMDESVFLANTAFDSGMSTELTL